MTEPVQGSHPGADAIAAFIDRRQAAEDRNALLAHLADCDQCRQEMLAARQVLRARGRRRLAAVAGGSAIAAALVLVLLPGGSPPATRSSAGAATIIVLGPVGEVATPIRLAWSGAGEGAAYRVVVTEADGASVWRGSTMDTTVPLPDSIVFHAGNVYLWWVDALLPDGTTLSSGVREFRPRE